LAHRSPLQWKKTPVGLMGLSALWQIWGAGLWQRFGGIRRLLYVT
jgi:hypothetical protein